MALERVVGGWLDGLNPRSHALWQRLGEHNLRTSSNLGRFARTRLILSLGKLQSSTWNQYSSVFSSFLTFLELEHIPLHGISDATLEQYICYHAEQTTPLAHGTIKSSISAIRTVLAQVGISLGPSPAVAGALQGYARLAAAIRPPPRVKRPWPPQYMMQAVLYAWPLLALFAAGTLARPEIRVLVSVAHMTAAFCTFSRGDTTQAQRVGEGDLLATPLTLVLGLVKQKRPGPVTPEQSLPASASPSCPIRFLCGYWQALQVVGYSATAFAYGVTPDAAKALSLEAALTCVITTLKIEQPAGNLYHAHSMRVGAVTAAFAIGVPLLTISDRCKHKDTKTTAGYVRHGVPPSAEAKAFFGHLVLAR